MSAECFDVMFIFFMFSASFLVFLFVIAGGIILFS